MINPFLKQLRGKVAFIMYSLPGPEDAIRKKLYRSFTSKPSAAQRKQVPARSELSAVTGPCTAE